MDYMNDDLYITYNVVYGVEVNKSDPCAKVLLYFAPIAATRF